MTSKKNIIDINAPYIWREGRGRSVQASVVGQVLEGIAKRDGRIEPIALVNESRPESAPTHSLFEWNDTIAAEEYRKHQARGVIRSIAIVRPEDGKPTPPAFLSVVFDPDADNEEDGKQHFGYVSGRTVQKSPEYREKVIRRELAEIEGWIDRTEWIAEFQPFRDALTTVLDTLKEKGGAA